MIRKGAFLIQCRLEVNMVIQMVIFDRVYIEYMHIFPFITTIFLGYAQRAVSI